MRPLIVFCCFPVCQFGKIDSVKIFISFITFLLIFFGSPGRVQASLDKAYTTVRITGFPAVIIKVGESIGYNIAGLIKSFYTKENELAGPDHEPYAKWKDKAFNYFMPQHFIDGKLIRWDANKNSIYYTSLYGAVLKSDAENSNHPEDTECIISEGIERSDPIEYAPLDMETAQFHNAYLGLLELKPNETGVIDMNMEPYEIPNMNPNEECGRNDVGSELEPLGDDLTDLSSFGGEAKIEGHEVRDIYTIIQKWIIDHWEEEKDYATEPNRQEVVLTQKKVIPHYECKGNDAGGKPSDIGECAEGSSKTGGWTAFTLLDKDKTDIISSSIQEYIIEITNFIPKKFPARYDLMNIADDRLKKAACYMVPDTSNTTRPNLQDTVVMGDRKDHQLSIRDKCGAPEQPSPTPTKADELACPLDAIEKSGGAGGSCGLCNANEYTEFMTDEEEAALPDGLSPLAIKILNAAGNAYNVPASMLFATMLGEGAFNTYRGLDWSSDENIRTYSDCNSPEPIPNCASQTSSTGASGPFGFLPTIWDKLMESGSPYEGEDPQVNALSLLEGVELSEENMNPCNFVDAAFMAARLIFEDSSHAFGPVPQSCTSSYGTFPVYQGNFRPASCSEWGTDRATVTRLQYGEGFCSEDTGRIVAMYDAMHCGN